MKKKYLYILGLMLYIQTGSINQALARFNDHKPSSKVVKNALGGGKEDAVESVTNCKLYVNGTEEKTLINILGLVKFKALEKCYQACGFANFKDETNYVLFDDEGNPIPGTETRNTQKEGVEVCGIYSCETSDVISSCQNELQPFIDNCRSNGGCGGYLGGQGYKQGGSNPYYQRPNLVDPGFPEVQIGY